MALKEVETILIVEDDPGVAVLERRRLERSGFGVVIATTAEEALRILRQASVDLVLLDFRLPGDLDGLDFYAQVRAAGYNPPVILVTGFSNEATVIKALRAGVRDFVTKSVEYLDYLPESIERVLRQVRTERKLAESEARLAAIIKSANDAMIAVEGDQHIDLFNKAAEQMFRCSADQALGHPLARYIPKEFTSPSASSREGAAQPTESLSHRIRSGTRGVRANGEVFPLEASVSHIEVAGREIYTIVVRDITERKRAEETLIESEERFTTFMNNSPAIAFIKDEAGRYVYMNAPFERHFGGKTGEQLGKTDDELWSAGTAKKLRDNDRIVLASGNLLEVEETFPAADGSTTHWLSYKFPFPDRSGRRLLGGVAIDITAKKRVEEQFRQAQKMEAIGQLAGGVAHDFNNLLTVIIGYSEMLLSERRSNMSAQDLLLEIKKSGERAASLTRQLLAFSRKQVLQPVELNLNTLLADIQKMLSRLIGEDIDLAVALDSNLGLVKADPGQIEQVIMNLAVNARDAMPVGGQLTIATQNVKLDAAYAENHPHVPPGDYVLLGVSDTGCGMEEATKARLFEPFFTTKEVGKGTGLGLATVYGIVKQSGGHIEVYSELGLGTTFKIYLPQTREAVRSAGESYPGLAAAARGTETVLLADDDDGVRRLARLTLQSFGYTVLAARDGDEALQIGQRHQGPLHLLVTDVVMPQMSGRELATRFIALRPNLKVLFLSGYMDDAVIRHGVLQEGTAFLQKPFTPSVLARKVREVLDR